MGMTSSGITGSSAWRGGVALPDAERVAAIRFTILDDAETCAAFGAAPMAELTDLTDRAAAVTGSHGLAECRTLLARLNDDVASLDLSRLEPRRGLAGLFDSRNKRLKAFRTAYTSRVTHAAQTAGLIGERAAVLSSRGPAIDSLWDRTRDAIADLDAHIAAADAWLADRGNEPTWSGVDTLVPSAAAEPESPSASEADAVTLQPEQPDTADGPDAALPSGLLSDHNLATTSEPASQPDTVLEIARAAEAAAPHPLQSRLDDLRIAQTAAIASLPALRAAQNAEHRLPTAFAPMADAVETWRLDWRDALGLAGRKPRKVRPDMGSMGHTRTVLTRVIAAADAEIANALARKTELEARGRIQPAQPVRP